MKILSSLLLLLASAIAFAQAHTATLNWTAPTQNVDGSSITGPITYNVYQGPSGALAQVQSGLTATSVVVTAGLTPGTTQCFAVTAVVNAVESAQSTPACVAIPYPTPNAPTGLIASYK